MGKGFLLVISGPSGTGKGTVCDEVLNRNKEILYSVSATTRQARLGEKDKADYFFVDKNKFKSMIEKDQFLEYANVHGNYYGTPKDFVVDQVEKGQVVLLEIDIQGGLQVKENYPEVISIFLLPPSMKELKDRITNRGTETEDEINIRYKNAFKELEYVNKYDYFVVNEEVNQAVEDIEAIIKAEQMKVNRHFDIKEKIIGKEGN